jgi:hypothetical protein
MTGIRQERREVGDLNAVRSDGITDLVATLLVR